MRIPLGVILALLAGLGGVARGAVIDGRLTTSLYSFEGLKTDTTSATFLRAYQGLRLDLNQLGAPALSLHTYLQGTTDLGEKAGTDPRLRLYHAYLKLKTDRLRLQLGRQRVSAGVGQGSIDGVWAAASRSGFDLDLYAGPLVSLDRAAEPGAWSEGSLWGGRLRTQRFLGAIFSLGFARRQRQTAAYAAPGRYSGVQAPAREIARQVMGIEGRRDFRGGHSLYGRLDYDLEEEQLRRGEVEGRYALSQRLSLQAEWLRRAPWISPNSLLGAFPREDYQEFGGRLYYRLTGTVQVAASFASTLYEDDTAQRLGLVLSAGDHYTLGYYRSMGYSRASDGVVGSVHYPLSPRLLLRGELDLASYERYEDAEDRDGLATGALGLSWRPMPAALVEAQVQGLRNPTHSSDARLLLRGSWHFFKRGR